MSNSNIEKLNDTFKLPIFYNKDKMTLNENIITDLELIETLDASNASIYQYTFKPQTNIGKKVLEQFPTHYTTDITYLKETQELMKKYTSLNLSEKEERKIDRPDYNNMMDIWDDIKNDTGFKEKYQYIDWSFCEQLNHSEQFLQLMSVYNLASPVISFFVPFFILIVPFFIIQMKGVELSFSEYIDVLKILAEGHAIGKLFTQFHSVKMDEKIYLLVSACFYLFSIYQNILTCVRFNENMKKIHIYLNDMRSYIKHSEDTMHHFLSFSSSLSSYSTFNEKIKEQLVHLTELRCKLEKITPYSFSLQKTLQFGYILKCFYDVYSNSVYNDAILYSFGFNGYIDNIEGLVDNIQEKHIHFSKFSKKDKKDKKDNKRKREKQKTENKEKDTYFKKAYYPTLMNNNPVYNDIYLNKNLIITGPNASGKTTILKSSLINIILTQQMGCGFYSKASIQPFKYIHCYLNIPDTSGRDSLFQAEARRCKDIIDIIQENTTATHFCVFDELYSGTNPDEAVISATAFMNYLIKFTTVNCMLTTHFMDICKHLERNESFENCHMETKKTEGENKSGEFTYTYLLKKGISNVRGGIKVLKDMNYPKEIIDSTC